ncbi:MAG: hypothetical protein ACPGNT_05400 [Rhodospirillales bacterium]
MDRYAMLHKVVIIAIAVVVVALGSIYGRQERPKFVEPESQAFLVGGYELTVPMGHLTRSMREWSIRYYLRRREETDLVLMQMGYPDMIPPTKEMLTTVPMAPTPKKFIRVSVASLGMADRPYDANQMSKMRAQGLCDAKDFMDPCSPDPINGLRSVDVYLLEPPNDFIFCDKIGARPRPHCEFTQILLDKLSIRLFFNRLLLDDALALRDAAYRHLCTWFDLPKDRTWDVNRCQPSTETPSG